MGWQAFDGVGGLCSSAKGLFLGDGVSVFVCRSLVRLFSCWKMRLFHIFGRSVVRRLASASLMLSL